MDQSTRTQKSAALITGSAKRIGREIAISLAKKGIDIVIHCNNSKKEAQDLEKEILAYGVDCKRIAMDLSNNCYEALISNALEQIPHLNILINNASIFEITPFLETSPDQMKRHLDINFTAPFFLTQNFVKFVKSGSVINILDSKIVRSSKNYFSYLLSKKILADFTKMSAAEVGPDIRINAVALGITDFSLDISDPIYLQKTINNLPLKKIAKSQQITDAVQYLINSDYLTGQIIFIDGGENLI